MLRHTAQLLVVATAASILLTSCATGTGDKANSGVDYDPRTGRYLLISDDRSAVDPARFYTAEIELDAGGLHDVVLTGVTLSVPVMGGRLALGDYGESRVIRRDAISPEIVLGASLLTLFVCLAAGAPRKTVLTEKAAASLVRKMRKTGVFQPELATDFIRTHAPGAYQPDFHAFETEKLIVLPWDREVIVNGELVRRPIRPAAAASAVRRRAAATMTAAPRAIRRKQP